MAVEILQRHSSILARPMSPAIPALWRRFMAREAEIAGRSEPDVTYGVMRHGPPETLLYMVAVRVRGDIRSPAADLGIRPAFMLERYGESFDPTDSGSSVEILIPVRRL